MRNLVLYFFLLVLGVPFDLTPDAVCKRGKFSEILAKKGLEFVPSWRGRIVALYLSLVWLPAEIDSFPEERGRKGDALVARGTGRIKMVLVLLAKIVALYMQVFIV